MWCSWLEPRIGQYVVSFFCDYCSCIPFSTHCYSKSFDIFKCFWLLCCHKTFAFKTSHKLYARKGSIHACSTAKWKCEVDLDWGQQTIVWKKSEFANCDVWLLVLCQENDTTRLSFATHELTFVTCCLFRFTSILLILILWMACYKLCKGVQ